MNIERLFMLRWRLEYADKPTKLGTYYPSTEPQYIGSLQTRSGLLYACIEGKRIDNHEKIILARVHRDDFRRFEWLAVSSLNPLGIKGSRDLKSTQIGMKIITAKNAVTVLVNGLIRIDELPRELIEQSFDSDGR